MALKHHQDLIMCGKLPGPWNGKLCEKCDGRCPICDSYSYPSIKVRICEECNYGSRTNSCIICGYPGVVDAFYCKECIMLEKDRDGCPRVINLGSAKTDLFYAKKSAPSNTNMSM